MWRNRAADLAFVSMESLSTFVLAGLVAGIGGHRGPGLVTMVLAALGGFLLARGLQQFDLPRQVLVGAGIIVSLVFISLLASLDLASRQAPASPLLAVAGGTSSVASLDARWTEIASLAFITIAWVRGALGGARSALSQRVVLSSLTVGLAIMVVGLSFGRATVSSRAIDQAAMPFFTVGLLSLALINLNQSEHIRGDSWRGPWLLVLMGTIGVILAVAALAGLLPLDLFDAVLAPLGFILLLLVDALIYLLALPTVIILNWLLTHLLSGRLHPIQLPPPPPANAAQQLHHQAHHGGLVLALINVAHFLLLLGLFAAILFALWWAYSRLRTSAPDETAVHEPLEHELGLADDLRAGLSALWRRFGPRAQPQEPPLSPRLRALRRLYLSLLDRARAAGCGRPPGVTPREFAPTLRRGLEEPGAEPLSYSFSAGRYGLIEPSEETLRQLSDKLGRTAGP